jgi:hypothetical protein
LLGSGDFGFGQTAGEVVEVIKGGDILQIIHGVIWGRGRLKNTLL